MAQGRVAWYSPQIGHGFIIPDQQKNVRIFVRHTDVVGDDRDLKNGDEVTYEAVEGPEGKEAKNVTRKAG